MIWKIPDVYYKDDPMWSFIPPDHVPNGPRWNHDDTLLFKHLPRTYTSFELISSRIVEGGTAHLFEWKGVKHPKPWPYPWEKGYKARIYYYDPVREKALTGIYSVWKICGNLFGRVGPRISDDPGHVYVNKLPGPAWVTFGTKLLK